MACFSTKRQGMPCILTKCVNSSSEIVNFSAALLRIEHLSSRERIAHFFCASLALENVSPASRTHELGTSKEYSKKGLETRNVPSKESCNDPPTKFSIRIMRICTRPLKAQSDYHLDGCFQ